MKKFLISAAALPFLSAVALAGQPLSDHQMDAVTAGFGAFATSAAAAEGGVIQATTANLAEVAIIAQVRCCVVSGTNLAEKTLNIVKSVSASSSTSSALNLPSNLPF